VPYLSVLEVWYDEVLYKSTFTFTLPGVAIMVMMMMMMMMCRFVVH